MLATRFRESIIFGKVKSLARIEAKKSATSSSTRATSMSDDNITFLRATTERYAELTTRNGGSSSALRFLSLNSSTVSPPSKTWLPTDSSGRNRCPNIVVSEQPPLLCPTPQHRHTTYEIRYGQSRCNKYKDWNCVSASIQINTCHRKQRSYWWNCKTCSS